MSKRSIEKRRKRFLPSRRVRRVARDVRKQSTVGRSNQERPADEDIDADADVHADTDVSDNLRHSSCERSIDANNNDLRPSPVVETLNNLAPQGCPSEPCPSLSTRQRSNIDQEPIETIPHAPQCRTTTERAFAALHAEPDVTRTASQPQIRNPLATPLDSAATRTSTAAVSQALGTSVSQNCARTDTHDGAERDPMPTRRTHRKRTRDSSLEGEQSSTARRRLSYARARLSEFVSSPASAILLDDRTSRQADGTAVPARYGVEALSTIVRELEEFLSNAVTMPSDHNVNIPTSSTHLQNCEDKTSSLPSPLQSFVIQDRHCDTQVLHALCVRLSKHVEAMSSALITMSTNAEATTADILQRERALLEDLKHDAANAAAAAKAVATAALNTFPHLKESPADVHTARAEVFGRHAHAFARDTLRRASQNIGGNRPPHSHRRQRPGRREREHMQRECAARTTPTHVTDDDSPRAAVNAALDEATGPPSLEAETHAVFEMIRALADLLPSDPLPSEPERIG